MEENKIKTENISKDIEYIKSLAEAGDKKPIPFAKVIFFASLVYVFYYYIGAIVFRFASNLITERLLFQNYPEVLAKTQPKNNIFNNVLLGINDNILPISLAIFILGIIFWRKYFFSKSETSVANKAAISIWVGVIIFIITRHYSVYLLLNNPENIIDSMKFHTTDPKHAQDQINYWKWWMGSVPSMSQVPNFLMISALGWWVTADMSAYKWPKLLAIIGFMLALLFSYYRTTIMETPLYSVGFTVFYFVLVPSAILMRQQAKTKE